MAPPPPPHALGTAEPLPDPLMCPSAFDQLLAHDPERAAALLRLLDGGAFMCQVAHHAVRVNVPITRILSEWAELLALTGEPKKAPPRPRPPRRWPSINPHHVPRRAPRTPHSPSDGRRRRHPRIRMRPVRAPAHRRLAGHLLCTAAFRDA